jgi:hypothetical protein
MHAVHTNSPIRALTLCLACVACLAACNQSGYELAPVRGTVTINGKMIKSGKVMFSPVAQGDNLNPGKPAFGMLRIDGSYVLTTYADNDGAVVGKHWVTVINSEEDLPRGVPEFARVTAPEQYTVVGGRDNQIDVEIAREDVLKYRLDDK